VNESEFGGSGISYECYRYITTHTPLGATVLEIGGGNVSTRALSMLYNLHTIEQNEKYIGLWQSQYIHAPIDDATGWYARSSLVGNVPTDAHTILVDGPSCGGRGGLLDNLDLFPVDALWIVHDTHREPERTQAAKLAEILGREVEYREPDYGVIR
jgi:hypothetical protein